MSTRSTTTEPALRDGGPIAAVATRRDAPKSSGPSPDATRSAPVADRIADIALMLLPGALIVALGFNAGGYFPGAPAAATILLAQILLVRVLRSSRPFDGMSRGTFVAIAALGAYAALTLASALWSHALGRALIEFGRVWLYLLALILFGGVRASTEQLRWLVRGLVLGSLIVCLAGLISRVAPDVWHTAPDVANQRLSYPVTYWNALGLLAAFGIVLSFHLTCSLSERLAMRVFAAAVLPLLAATLFFTFSRGAIAAGAIGFVLYVIVSRPRGLLSGTLSTLPSSAALVLVAYHANLLDTVDPTTPAAVAQGHRVALAAGLLAGGSAVLRLVFAIRLDPRLDRWAARARVSQTARRGAIGGVAVATLLAILALGVPHAVARDWNRFFSGAIPHGNRGDLRQRLTDPSNNGRSDLWHVAVTGFESSPLHGHGAGTYQTLWNRERPVAAFTLNAHSLYLQAMAEFGIPGLLLLVALVGGALLGLAARARGSRRSVYGVLLAVSVVWALHAGVDWDWEMPVVTLPFFAAAGLALGPRAREPRHWTVSRPARLVLAAACVGAAVLPVLIIGSQSKLDEAKRALYASDCAKAVPAADSSIAWLSARSQPYEILALCDAERGSARLAVAETRKAVSRDPGSWEPYYLLAIAQASAGVDPRASAARALSMNPLEPLTRQAVSQLRGSSPRRWAQEAASLRAAALASNNLSIVPL
jgi:hypothetical protein